MSSLFVLAGIALFFCCISNTIAYSNSRCPIADNTNIVYSMVNGVGPASIRWVQDFLWWWKSYDDSINYIGLNEADFQNCRFTDYPNLRIYVNPGGDAYDQLGALTAVGTSNIIDFINRDQMHPSSYVGFCAGTYIASHDYIWETLYEGVDYYNYTYNPPMSLFPHMVEGSIVDIGDDQFGDKFGFKHRLVNVSNGHQMLYYGGSTFGYNGAVDYTNPNSPYYDPEIEVVVYYSDFYGYNSVNIPAAWRYKSNMLLTSVHPEADNCTHIEGSPNVANDCPPPGTIPVDIVLQNRAWLATYMNKVSQSNFFIPEVPIAPLFDTTPPHKDYPSTSCQEDYEYAKSDSVLLYCHDFDAFDRVPEGLSPYFQRNQSAPYNVALPWNTSYIESWNGIVYTKPQNGNGYAYVTPMANINYNSSITTKSIPIQWLIGNSDRFVHPQDGFARVCPKGSPLHVSFWYTGQTVWDGGFSASYMLEQGVSDHVSEDIGDGENVKQNDVWKPILTTALYPRMDGWKTVSFDIPALEVDIDYNLKLKFVCASGYAADNYCAIDSIAVQCAK